MKRKTKLWIGIACIVLIAASFLAGSHMKEQEYNSGRTQHCSTLISFAIEKAENQDISDPDTMEALISNVYAAYQFCDDSNLAEQLHDLWNTLIFDGDRYIGREAALAEQLRTIQSQLQNP